MEDKQTFAIGDRVEQMCITCGEERGHIVASMTKKGKITRVSCPICGSRVPYKSGTTRRTSSKVGAPYDRARTYRRGQVLMHADLRRRRSNRDHRNRQNGCSVCRSNATADPLASPG